MTPGARLELASEARADVARAAVWLERSSVEAIERSAAELALATARLQALNKDASGDRTIKSTLLALRTDLRRADLLLRRAWAFRVRLAGVTSYTRTGEIASQSSATNRWAMEG